MALSTLEKIRYKTTTDRNLLPDSVIVDLIGENTVDGELNLNLTLADAFDYMASTAESAGGTVKSWSRGGASMTFVQTWRETAAYYRQQGGAGGAPIVQKTISRTDFGDPSSDTEFGPRPLLHGWPL